MAGIVWDNGWHWIFVLVRPNWTEIRIFSLLANQSLLQEGLATIVVAVFAYWFIYNYPDTAGFLTEKERSVIQARLSADNHYYRLGSDDFLPAN